MNFGKFDMVIIITMSIAVIGLSFTLPALGLTEAGTDENDIPEFNINSERFDLVDDFPESPGTPTEGTLELDTGEIQFSDNEVWLDGNTDNGTEITLVEVGGTPRITVLNWDSGNATTETWEFNSTGERQVIQNFSYTIRFEVIEFDQSGTDNTYAVEWEITEQPETDGGWIGRIPVIGTVFSAAEAAASVGAWIGSIIHWGILWIIELAANLIGLLFDAMVFLIDALGWLTGTYAEVISAADSWAAVFVAVPGLLLFVELVKLVMVGIKLLPTT